MPRRSMGCRSSAGAAATLYQQQQNPPQQNQKRVFAGRGSLFIEMQIECRSGRSLSGITETCAEFARLIKQSV